MTCPTASVLRRLLGRHCPGGDVVCGTGTGLLCGLYLNPGGSLYEVRVSDRDGARERFFFLGGDGWPTSAWSREAPEPEPRGLWARTAGEILGHRWSAHY